VPSVPVKHASIEALAPDEAPISLKQAVASITALQASVVGSQTAGVAIAAERAPVTKTATRPSEKRILKTFSDFWHKKNLISTYGQSVDDYEAASPTKEELVIASIYFYRISFLAVGEMRVYPTDIILINCLLG